MAASPQKQKDLLTGRWRNVRPPSPSESQIQKALVRRCQYQMPSDIVMFHVPNGGYREAITGRHLKELGTLRGVADLVFIFPVPQPILFLELKAFRGRLSEYQEAFCAKIRAAGHCYESTDTLNEATAILQRYGVLPC